MNKTIYLGTTYKCSACKCMEAILKEFHKHNNFELVVMDFKELPEWIKTNVKLTDFPVTIFVKDNVIKYNVVGTKSISKLKEIVEDIDF